VKKIPKAVYRTADEIETLIKQREAEAASQKPGSSPQSILIEVAQLRATQA
jgi:hypothetical protein